MAKALKVTSLRIEIQYFPNGELEYAILVPDTRKTPEAVRRKQKWRKDGSGWCRDAPSWDELHQISVILHENGIRIPEPIESLISEMKFDVHCLSIRKPKPAKLKTPG